MPLSGSASAGSEPLAGDRIVLVNEDYARLGLFASASSTLWGPISRRVEVCRTPA
jgi:hypothetical protein